MPTLYAIGIPEGPVRIGVGKPEKPLLEVLSVRPEARILGAWRLPSRAAGQVAMAILRKRLGFPENEARRDAATVIRFCGRVADSINAGVPNEQMSASRILASLLSDWSASRRFLATVCGVSPSLVSRWLSGDLIPSASHIVRLREFARLNGLPWDDDAMLAPSAWRLIRTRAETGNADRE